ncbi:MAG: DUF3368 domain-containing protein [Blastocatellia bacterium]
MIVVSDTTPINYLILIDQINLLKNLYEHVIIPEAVIEEMQRSQTPEKVRQWVSSQPDWIEVRQTNISDTTLNLGAGERAAILLAKELGADLILMDDRKGRQAALDRGLVVLGTLAVLVTAAKREMIDLPTALRQLLKTSFRAPADLIQSLLDENYETER